MRKFIKKIVDFNFFFDWFDFGIMLRFYKPTKTSKYHLCVDFQLLWFNIWLQLFKKSEKV